MNIKEESDLLTREIQRLEGDLVKGDAQAKLAEVELLNQLILKKSFKWTSVFASLERAKGENVRLVSLRPFVDEEGRTGLNLDIRGRTLADATEFLRTLEASHVFTDVVLAVTDEKKDNVGEVAFTLSSYYNSDESKPEKRNRKKRNRTRRRQAKPGRGRRNDLSQTAEAVHLCRVPCRYCGRERPVLFYPQPAGTRRILQTRGFHQAVAVRCRGEQGSLDWS